MIIYKKIFLDMPHNINIEPKRGEKIMFNDGVTVAQSLLNPIQTYITELIFRSILFAFVIVGIKYFTM